MSGKGPDFGHASGGGKRGGMAGTARFVALDRHVAWRLKRLLIKKLSLIHI